MSKKLLMFAGAAGAAALGSRQRRHSRRRGSMAMGRRADKVAARELKLYMDNDQQIYRQIRSVRQNLLRKVKSGKYNAALSVKAWMYPVEAGAKKYTREFGGTWHEMFPKSTRELVAREYAEGFDADLKGAGSWESLADDYGVRGEYGLKARGSRAGRTRRYKSLAALKRNTKNQLSLDNIVSGRAYFKKGGYGSFNYDLTNEDTRDIAKALGGQHRTQERVASSLFYGAGAALPSWARERIVYTPYGWSYIAGQDYRAETARLRKILS